MKTVALITGLAPFNLIGFHSLFSRQRDKTEFCLIETGTGPELRPHWSLDPITSFPLKDVSHKQTQTHIFFPLILISAKAIFGIWMVPHLFS